MSDRRSERWVRQVPFPGGESAKKPGPFFMPQKQPPKRRRRTNTFLDIAQDLIELMRPTATVHALEILCLQCRKVFHISSLGLFIVHFCPYCGTPLRNSAGQPRLNSEPPNPQPGPDTPSENQREAAAIWLSKQAGLFSYISSNADMRDRTIRKAYASLHARGATAEEFRQFQYYCEMLRKQ